MLGFPLLYFKGMRLIMFQLSGFHCMCSCTLQCSKGPIVRPGIGNGLDRIPQMQQEKQVMYGCKEESCQELKQTVTPAT